MDEELFLIERIDSTTSLCVSPVSSKTFALSELDNLGGDRGYFLYEVDERPIVGGMQILAKIASLDAAFRLSEIWKMATRKEGRTSASKQNKRPLNPQKKRKAPKALRQPASTAIQA